MSQIQGFGLGGMPVAGPLLTLTGDDGGAVSPSGAGNIKILGLGSSDTRLLGAIVGIPASNELLVVPFTITVTTNDATNTEIFVETLSDNSSMIISADIVGVRDDFTATCGGTIVAIGRKPGAGAVLGTQSGQVVNDYVGNPKPSAGAGVSATQLRILVRGTPAETWNWRASIRLHTVA